MAWIENPYRHRRLLSISEKKPAGKLFTFFLIRGMSVRLDFPVPKIPTPGSSLEAVILHLSVIELWRVWKRKKVILH